MVEMYDHLGNRHVVIFKKMVQVLLDTGIYTLPSKVMKHVTIPKQAFNKTGLPSTASTFRPKRGLQPSTAMVTFSRQERPRLRHFIQQLGCEIPLTTLRACHHHRAVP